MGTTAKPPGDAKEEKLDGTGTGAAATMEAHALYRLSIGWMMDDVGAPRREVTLDVCCVL